MSILLAAILFVCGYFLGRHYAIINSKKYQELHKKPPFPVDIVTDLTPENAPRIISPSKKYEETTRFKDYEEQ